MADPVWTVTFYGSLDNPAALSPEVLKDVLARPRYAFVRAEDDDGGQAIMKVYEELKKRRDRQESIICPQRERWLETHPGSSLHVNLIFTALIPLEQGRWVAERGRREDMKKNALDLTKEL